MRELRSRGHNLANITLATPNSKQAGDTELPSSWFRWQILYLWPKDTNAIWQPSDCVELKYYLPFFICKVYTRITSSAYFPSFPWGPHERWYTSDVSKITKHEVLSGALFWSTNTPWYLGSGLVLTLVSRDLQEIMSLPLQHKIRETQHVPKGRTWGPEVFLCLGMTKADIVYHILNIFNQHASKCFCKVRFRLRCCWWYSKFLP